MANSALILGIDTSCDETSLALLDATQNCVLVNLISSQIRLHQEYGGVVPELASRQHLQNLPVVFAELLQKAGIAATDIGAVAVTQTPGLIGCLLVGTSFAKALAYRCNIPLYGVNHLEAHLFSPYIDAQPQFPFLGLVVSGGHTAFYKVSGFSEIELLGQTIDDAAGEAFDKGAKLLGLGYPGGPVVDKLSKSGNPQSFVFSVPRVKWSAVHLSFSGLKTAMLHHVQNACRSENVDTSLQLKPQTVADLCASLQNGIVRTLADKLDYFLNQDIYRAVALSGGVAMNSLLRTEVARVCAAHSMACDLAKPAHCTDNAAMVAYLAAQQKRSVDIFALAPSATSRPNAKNLKVQADRVGR